MALSPNSGLDVLFHNEIVLLTFKIDKRMNPLFHIALHMVMEYSPSILSHVARLSCIQVPGYERLPHLHVLH